MAIALMVDDGGAVVAHPSFPATACSGELSYNILVVQWRSRVRLELRWSGDEAWVRAWWHGVASTSTAW